jgi:hypothetical protein
MVVRSLDSEAAALYEYGRDRGSNVHLVAEITLRRKLLDAASSDDDRGKAQNDLGTALRSLGARESGTGRLEEAVAAYRDALKGNDARARAAAMGYDAEQSRQCVIGAGRARERHGAAGGGGRGLPRRAEGNDARARAA